MGAELIDEDLFEIIVKFVELLPPAILFFLFSSSVCRWKANVETMFTLERFIDDMDFTKDKVNSADIE